MQVLHVAGIARAIVIEVIAVEARHAVPGSYPDIAQIVLVEHRNSITAEAVFGREM